MCKYFIKLFFFFPLDWLRHNLYWLDSTSNVQVMRLIRGRGGHRTYVIRGLSSPLDIAVAPLAG